MFDRPLIKIPLRNVLKAIEPDEQKDLLIN
jgi:hypothetical protein